MINRVNITNYSASLDCNGILVAPDKILIGPECQSGRSFPTEATLIFNTSRTAPFGTLGRSTTSILWSARDNGSELIMKPEIIEDYSIIQFSPDRLTRTVWASKENKTERYVREQILSLTTGSPTTESLTHTTRTTMPWYLKPWPSDNHNNDLNSLVYRTERKVRDLREVAHKVIPPFALSLSKCANYTLRQAQDGRSPVVYS